MQKVLSRLPNTKAKIWKVCCDSNVYLLKLDEPVLIDTGRRANKDILKRYLDQICPFSKIKRVIFTHLHYDHIGNFDLFKNAEFFASKDEIDSFRKDPYGTVLNEDMADRFNCDLKEAVDFDGFKMISTPGHTVGSICILYEPEKIIFSGDTFFRRGVVGRTDLPTSRPELLRESFMKIINYKYKTICPGHDY